MQAPKWDSSLTYIFFLAFNFINLRDNSVFIAGSYSTKGDTVFPIIQSVLW